MLEFVVSEYSLSTVSKVVLIIFNLLILLLMALSGVALITLKQMSIYKLVGITILTLLMFNVLCYGATKLDQHLKGESIGTYSAYGEVQTNLLDTTEVYEGIEDREDKEEIKEEETDGVKGVFVKPDNDLEYKEEMVIIIPKDMEDKDKSKLEDIKGKYMVFKSDILKGKGDIPISELEFSTYSTSSFLKGNIYLYDNKEEFKEDNKDNKLDKEVYYTVNKRGGSFFEGFITFTKETDDKGTETFVINIGEDKEED